jgi:hypothetical protein
MFEEEAMSLECWPIIMTDHPVASGNATETQDTNFVIMVCLKSWSDNRTLICTHCWELMKSLGSHCSSSLLFMMKVMV